MINEEWKKHEFSFRFFFTVIFDFSAIATKKKWRKTSRNAFTLSICIFTANKITDHNGKQLSHCINISYLWFYPTNTMNYYKFNIHLASSILMSLIFLYICAKNRSETEQTKKKKNLPNRTHIMLNTIDFPLKAFVFFAINSSVF